MTLEAALEERDMKASELIRRSGVSAPTIYNITSPNKAPYKTGDKTDTLAKIAEVLNARRDKMKTVKGNVLTILGIVAAIVAVSCGDTINGCETTVQMLGWAFVSLMLLATALVLCALGVSAEKEHEDNERMGKLNRIPAHINKWRNVR